MTLSQPAMRVCHAALRGDESGAEASLPERRSVTITLSGNDISDAGGSSDLSACDEGKVFGGGQPRSISQGHGREAYPSYASVSMLTAGCDTAISRATCARTRSIGGL